jgi:hypothetical protein
MKTAIIVSTLATILLSAGTAATAATIDFTGIDIAQISSWGGQDFTYTNGSGPSTGTVNVSLNYGNPTALQTGAGPDTTGFYALQDGGNLTPMSFHFSFDVPQSFTITQNESLAEIEVNSFTLPSGSWTLLSMDNATSTGSGTNITFVGANNTGPWGTYAISGSGSSFDFAITNFAGFPDYGSAISLDVGAVVGPVGPVVAISLAVRLQCSSESGKNYQAQFSYDMNSWTNVGVALPGTGQTVEFFDAAQPDPKRFYRIEVQ